KQLAFLLDDYRNPAPFVWSTIRSTVGASQGFGETPHRCNCIRPSRFDVARLCDRNRAVAEDGLNHRVIHCETVQVGSQTSTESMPTDPLNLGTLEHILHLAAIERLQIERSSQRVCNYGAVQGIAVRLAEFVKLFR